MSDRQRAELHVKALELILAQTGGCERDTSGLGACFRNGRTADAQYSADQACPSCIANAALHGEDIPVTPKGVCLKGPWTPQSITYNGVRFEPVKE